MYDMKSCCSACKQGKPCQPDLAPRSLSGFRRRRSIGYGVYGDEAPAVEAVEEVVIAAPAPPSFIDQNKQTIIYLVAALALYKILF